MPTTKKTKIKRSSKTTTKKASKKKPVVKKTTKKTAKKKVVAKKAAKKTAKKTAGKAAKKATKKKSTSKTKQKTLVYAPDEKSFWCVDGQILNSLVALRDALDRMEKEVYQYHAGKAQNDFAVWVEKVLRDRECATALKKTRTPKTAQTVVVKRLKLYSV